MLSYMQHYHLLNRDVFVWDLDRIRTELRDDVKKELKKRKTEAILQDRQISQFATLVTVYHWIYKDYRVEIETLANKSRSLENEESETYRSTQQKTIQSDLDELMEMNLYNFVKNEIVRTAVVAARHDPLTDYIETIGTLIQARKVTKDHFSWTKKGHLKIWAKAIWDVYEGEKRGTDSMVRRDTVEEKLKELSELSSDGELKVVNWTNEDSTKVIRQRGFYIKSAVENELFRNNFNWEEYRPNGAPSYYQMDTTEQTPEIDDELPF